MLQCMLHIARLLMIPIEYIKWYYLVVDSYVNSMILLVIHKLEHKKSCCRWIPVDPGIIQDKD
jgi:hypothetical protein